MAESGLSYREVTQTQNTTQQWKEITIQTGKNNLQYVMYKVANFEPAVFSRSCVNAT